MTLDFRAGLYEAAQQIIPTRPDYATVPIQAGFKWSTLADGHFDRLYLVVFRSVRRPDADLDLLREYDDQAYAEAVKSGGLLRYFKGEMNEKRECLSFCLWESGERARAASGGKLHQRAASIAAEMYESYLLDRYAVGKVHTVDGVTVVFEPINVKSEEHGARASVRELREGRLGA